MGELDVSDILKDATIVYTFDAKTSQLQSIVMDEFEVDISKAMEQSDPSIGEMSMTMSMELNISDYGKITADDVAVPKNVKDGAVEQSELEADAGLDISTEDIGLGDGATSISPATSEAPINTDKPRATPHKDILR